MRVEQNRTHPDENATLFAISVEKKHERFAANACAGAKNRPHSTGTRYDNSFQWHFWPTHDWDREFTLNIFRELWLALRTFAQLFAESDEPEALQACKAPNKLRTFPGAAQWYRVAQSTGEPDVEDGRHLSGGYYYLVLYCCPAPQNNVQPRKTMSRSAKNVSSKTRRGNPG